MGTFPFGRFQYNFNVNDVTNLDAIIGVFAFAGIFAFSFAFLFYIFNALGLYKIAKNRGYNKSWLAFIPIANVYLLGAIVDNINQCNLKKSSFRVWTLLTSVLSTIFGSAYLAYSIIKLVNELTFSAFSEFGPDPSVFATMFLSSSLFSLAAIINFVLICICQYKLFADYDYKNATLFLVLSILFKISPFFIFAIRNNKSISLQFASMRANQYQQAPNQPFQAAYQQQPYQQPQHPYQQPQQPYQQPQHPYQQPQHPYQQPQQPQQPYQQQPQQPVTPPPAQPVQNPVVNTEFVEENKDEDDSSKE